MTSFETTAIVDDASHLTLREPLPESFARKCRVVVLSESTPDSETSPTQASPWTEEFFESIHITDPAFERQPQGDMPPAPVFDE